MRATSAAALLVLALSAARGEDAPAPAPAPPVAPEAPQPPAAFTLEVTARIEEKDGKHVVVVEGATSLPEKTLVSLHFYVTFTGRQDRERVNFIDGRSTAVHAGKVSHVLGPYAMALGTYRLEAVVDPQRQYPDVEKALKDAPIPKPRVELKLGTDEEIAEEREIGRPRALHASESLLALKTELLGHSKDLQGPLERGDWEAPWAHHLLHLCGRLRPQTGEVVGRNQVSRPLSEPFDHTDAACFDALRAMRKAYRGFSQAPAVPPAKTPEDDIPAWTEPVDAAALEALTSRALDAMASDYEQDLLLRLEAMVKTAKDLHREAQTEPDPAAPKRRGGDARQQWPARQAAWLEESRQLREELSLLTDETSPRPFIKQMAHRLLPRRQEELALAAEAETIVKGLGRSVASGKAPEDEISQALDRFYAGYATLLMAQLSGAPR